MPPAPHRERLFVSTTPGLEGVLAAEAAALGDVTRVEGGVELEGPPGALRAANLRLRTASRVLLRVASLPADSPRALLEALAGVDLAPYRGAQGFSLSSVEVARGPIPRRELQRAVEDGLAPWGLSPPPRDEGGAAFTAGPVELFVRAEGSRVLLSVDTSGELLFRRGYRQEVSRAPLRETLAAGVLALAGHRPGETLVDPMCGSGTLLIEGLWRSMGRAPGLQRPFAFETFPAHDRLAWESEKQRAREGEGAAAPVFGSDLNAGALGTARRNARRAGVLEALTLERLDIAALGPPPGPPGLVVVNPPYGRRVGARDDLDALYAALGHTLRTRFRGWRAAVLVPEPALGRALDLPAPALHGVDNGGLRVTLQVAALP